MKNRTWPVSPKVFSIIAAMGLLLSMAGSHTRAATVHAPAPITIGMSLSLTGNFLADGVAFQQGYALWAADINKQGGLLGRPVKLITLSDASSAAQATTDYQKLINVDHVDLLFGPFTQPQVDVARSLLEKGGIKTAYLTVYPAETTDYASIADAVIHSNAQAGIFGTLLQDISAFIQAFRQQHFNPRGLIATAGPDQGASFIKAIGLANTEGIFVPNGGWFPDANTPGNKVMVQEYLSPVWSSTVFFALLVVLLLVRPQGLFGTGAYALAIICQDWNVQGDVAPFLLMPVSGLIAAAIAVPLGAIALRARRHTFVVITIAIFFIIQLLSYNLRDLTNGSTGLSLPIPSWTGGFYNLPFYYCTLAFLVAALAASWWIRNAKYGLALLAIRDDEDRAPSLGVRTGPAMLIAFVISAFFVGTMGAMFGFFLEAIAPASVFDTNFDIALALMTFMGGLGTLAGPVLGALIIEPAQQYVALQYGTSGWYLVLYGVLFCW